MRIIAAYLLAVLGGNASPDASAVNNILASVGIEAEQDRVEKLVADMKGKDLAEVIKAGSAKLSTLSVGSGSGASAPAPSASSAPAPKAEAKPAPKEESDAVRLSTPILIIFRTSASVCSTKPSNYVGIKKVQTKKMYNLFKKISSRSRPFES
jgi:large subunit ribosomal protein LP2